MRCHCLTEPLFTNMRFIHFRLNIDNDYYIKYETRLSVNVPKLKMSLLINTARNSHDHRYIPHTIKKTYSYIQLQIK